MEDNFTVVTGFFDINRDKWNTKHQRSTQTYFKYIKNMMGMDVKMLIFIEPKNLETFISFRKGKEDKTTFILKNFNQLSMYPHIKKMRVCQTNNNIIKHHPDKNCPELILPEYNVLVNSKFSLLREAAEGNPFKTDFFCWIDAGYTHSTINLKNKKFDPTILYNYHNRITFSQLLPCYYMKQKTHDFYIQHIDVVSAGFIFGKKDILIKFDKIYTDFFIKILNEGISDDEQFYMALLLRERPELFNPIFMGWFGSLKLT